MIYIRCQRASIVGSSTAGLTLGIDSGHKNTKTGFYPKCLRPFLWILCIVDDSIYACRRKCSCARSQLYNYSDKVFSYSK